MEPDSLVGTFLRDPERFGEYQRVIGPDVSRKIARMIGLDSPRLATRMYELSGLERPPGVLHFAANFSPGSRELVVSFGEHCNVVHVWRTARATLSLVATLKLRARFAAFDDSATRIVLATDVGCCVWPFAGETVRPLKYGSAVRALFAGASAVWMRLEDGSAKLVGNVDGDSPRVLAEVEHVSDVRWHRAAKMTLVLHRRMYSRETDISLFNEQGEMLGQLCEGRSMRCHLTEPLVYVDDSTIYDVLKRVRLVGGVTLVQSEHEYDPALSSGGYDLVAIGTRWVNLLRSSFLMHYMSKLLPLDQAIVLLMCQIMHDWRLADETPPPQEMPASVASVMARGEFQFDLNGGAQPTWLPLVDASAGVFTMPTGSDAVAETAPQKERYRFSTVRFPHLRRVIEGMPEELQRWVALQICNKE